MTLSSEPTARTIPAPRFTQRDILLIAILAIATLALYLHAWHFDFIMYDDPLYVSGNIHVQQGLSMQSLHWALTALPNNNWHPLTNIAQLLISSVFGQSPAAFHGVNIVLHALNVVLLYLFLRKATGQIWPAFFVALLWGLHPERVESVAWVSELKDVLCGVFWLGCMLAYVRYSRRRTIAGLVLVTLLQTLSLLSKPMAVTLPFLLLLLDYWPLGREGSAAPPQSFPEKLPGQTLDYRSLDRPDSSTSTLRWWAFRILEKLPMLALAVADIVLQQNPLSMSSRNLTFGLRVENAIVSYALYLRDIFFPRHLSLFYPHPIMFRQPGGSITIPTVQVASALVLLLLISVVVFMQFRKRPYLAVGWCWFLGTLVPVIGLVQSGQQARADRFTYMPAIGICVAIVWWISELCTKESARRYLATGAALLCTIAIALVSFKDIRYWQNSDTLFTHVLDIQPRNFLAMAMLSERATENGQLSDALALGRRAVDLSPFSPDARKAWALALLADHQYPAAAIQAENATRLESERGSNWDVFGSVLYTQANQLIGKNDPKEKVLRERALDAYQKAIERDPDDPAFYEHLALEYASTNDLDKAIPAWEQAIVMKPAYEQAHGDLADALRIKGDLPGAIEHYRLALAAGSTNASWKTSLAYLIATSPEATDAEVQPMIAIAKDACEQTKNQDPAALDAYAACLARAAVWDGAIEAAKQGIAVANAQHNPAVAKGIENHLSFYLKNQPFIKTTETTQPATTQSATR